MIEYSPSYMAFADSLLKSNKELINEWARDDRNPELKESCKMLMDAAGVGQK
ncbi:MAG: hypothetical protein OIN90_04580 [Candidatus Methanoperedens sp.]|nr:hypothetical protein [Candidatus Methanoperedens sp.]